MALAQVWKGAVKLPSKEEMNAEVDKRHAFLLSGVAQDGPTIGPYEMDASACTKWLHNVAGTGFNEKFNSGLKGWWYWLKDLRNVSNLIPGVNSPHLWRLFDGGGRSGMMRRMLFGRSMKIRHPHLYVRGQSFWDPSQSIFLKSWDNTALSKGPQFGQPPDFDVSLFGVLCLLSIQPVHQQSKNTTLNLLHYHSLCFFFFHPAIEGGFKEWGVVTNQILVYDKAFFVRLDIDIDSDEGLGTTGRLESQPENDSFDDHRVLTYEKFSFGFSFWLRAIDCELPIVATAKLSSIWDDFGQDIPYLES
jgi:hypothetical protein